MRFLLLAMPRAEKMSLTSLGVAPEIPRAGRQLPTMLRALGSLFRTSAELRLENLALRHQLGVLRRSAPKQLKLTPADRVFWVCLRRVC